MSGSALNCCISVFGDLEFCRQPTLPYFRRSLGRQVSDRDDQGGLGDGELREESDDGLATCRKGPEGTIQTFFVRTWHTKILAPST